MNSNENAPVSPIEEFLRDAEPEKIPSYNAAIDSTPRQYSGWLFDILKEDNE
jgi:hypothetical protein